MKPQNSPKRAFQRGKRHKDKNRARRQRVAVAGARVQLSPGALDADKSTLLKKQPQRDRSS